MKILNFGSLNMDHVYEMTHFVQGKETLSAKDYHTHVGGKGLNQSIAMAAAALSVMHAGKVGADGEELLALLQSHGVDTSLVRTSSKASGHAIIQVAEGENCIIVYGGANRDIDAQMIDEVLSHFTKGDVLLVQNEISALTELLQRAHAIGMRIVMNPSPIDEELLAAPLELCEVLIFNEVEGAALSGCAPSAYADILRTLAKRFPGVHLVLTCGGEGAMALANGELVQQAAFPADVVDTTCAGDTFTGFYLSAYLQGRSVSQALRIACRAAALSVEKAGAAQSIPTWESVMRKEGEGSDAGGDF